MTDEYKTPQDTSFQREVDGFDADRLVSGGGEDSGRGREQRQRLSTTMNEVDMEELYRESLDHIQEGEIIKGTDCADRARFGPSGRRLQV